MTVTRVIPCLDVSNGRVVKGVQFQNLREIGSPVELAEYYETAGADELVFLDISATVEGRQAQQKWIREVRSVLSIPLTVGGGVNSINAAEELLFSGADKVAVNSGAVNSPELISQLSQTFGRQCVVLAIDAISQNSSDKAWNVVTHAGKKIHDLSVVSWAKRGVVLGAGEVLLTSWNQDGTGNGYDLRLIRAVFEATGVPVIASGGAKTIEHLAEAVEAGASAVLAASIFHDKKLSIAEVKLGLAKLGIQVRRI